MDASLPRLCSIRDILTAGRVGGGHESAGPHAAGSTELKPSSVLERVTTALDAAASTHHGKSLDEKFEEARSLLLEQGGRALRKLSEGRQADGFTDDELGALEAVVQFDGSRPAFVLRDGGIDPNHPFLGGWANDIRGGMTEIRRCAASVGRLEPLGGGPLNFMGTGFVYDRSARLVLTAGHVLEKIAKRVGREVKATGSILELGEDMRIDFNGEADATEKCLFKVSAGLRVGVADIAVLSVRPLMRAEDAEHADGVIPPRLEKGTGPAPGGPPIASSICLIGFPARFEPPRSNPKGHQINWEWVRHHLTGATQGVKRLAPGFPSRQPDPVADDRGRVFGHDATSAGGNSGSPVIAWKDRDQPAIGVHVSGATFVSNEAEFLACIQSDLDGAIEVMRKLPE